MSERARDGDGTKEIIRTLREAEVLEGPGDDAGVRLYPRKRPSTCASMSKPSSSEMSGRELCSVSFLPGPSDEQPPVQCCVGAPDSARWRDADEQPARNGPRGRRGAGRDLPSIHPACPRTQGRQYINAGRRHSHCRPLSGHAQAPASGPLVPLSLPCPLDYAAALVAIGVDSCQGVPSRSIACITLSR